MRIFNKQTAFLVFLLFIGAGFQFSVVSAREPEKSSDTETNVLSFNDGPHVFRADDSSMIVFYLSGGEVVRKTFAVTDTLRFRGFGADTAEEYVIAREPTGNELAVFKDVSRIFVLSDIHGEYDYLRNILNGAGIIDNAGHWKWGTGHLVIDGDVFDRGDMVTECLWLIYRLEREARESGGAVHFILGNHELMVLRGDERYVNDKYLEGIVKKTRIRYDDLYGPDMELGRWLRTLPTVVKLNDILFVHGGISPSLLDYGLSQGELNAAVLRGLDWRTSRLVFNDTVNFLFGGKGPFWYRGYLYEMEDRYPKATDGDIDRILTLFDARKIVVGHTEIDSVMGLYDNRIFDIDIPVEDFGGFQGLLWEGGRYYRVAADGSLKLLDD